MLTSTRRTPQGVVVGWMAALALAAMLALTPSARAQVRFTIELGANIKEPATGRLVVSVNREGSKVPMSVSPLDAPFWDEPQPVWGVTTTLAPGKPFELPDNADATDVAPSALKPGTYAAAARLITRRNRSGWRDEPGNLFSKTVTFTVEAGKPTQVKIVLDQITVERVAPKDADVTIVEIESKLLSEFHGRPVVLRAGVVKPINFEQGRQYAAIYHVAGFGGDHFVAFEQAARRKRLADPTNPHANPERDLGQATYFIALDAESPNGHTLFADSENNGPWAKALVTELVPELDKRFGLITKPEARLLRGHSSGGWSTLWLALTHPETFGAVWTSSPDPVDFRRFQTIDIYAGTPEAPGSMYVQAGTTTDAPSFRKNGEVKMTVRQENQGERILGPDQTSGQQWASWQAVFGPRVGERGWGKGHPAALYDAKTGVIDPAVAKSYRAYDIGAMLRENPAKYAPIFARNVRLVVGDLDNFYLNEAVVLLKADYDKIVKEHPEYGSLDAGPGQPVMGPGYIEIAPGFDHGTIYGSKTLRVFAKQMFEHLQARGLLPPEGKPGRP